MCTDGRRRCNTVLIASLYKKFQDYSAKGSVWLYADTHFGDQDMIDYFNYPPPQEHIDILKKFCHKNDTLILLGDVGDPSYLKQLKCRIILITGNHDLGPSNYEEFCDEVYSGPLTIADKILLTHEPVDLPFCLNISGHNHSNWGSYQNVINVAANIVGFRPVNLKDIIQSGRLKNIPDIHRIAIDRQIEYKKEKIQ